MIHYFTFGEKGKRGLFLTKKQAALFNRFTASFFDAQQAFFEEHGRRWHYTEKLPLPFGDEDQLRDSDDLDAYNRMTRILERQWWFRNHILHLPNREEHMDGEFLVKRF